MSEKWAGSGVRDPEISEQVDHTLQKKLVGLSASQRRGKIILRMVGVLDGKTTTAPILRGTCHRGKGSHANSMFVIIEFVSVKLQQSEPQFT